MANKTIKAQAQNLLTFAQKQISSSKHLAVWNWLTDCPLFSDLFFTFAMLENGDVVYTPSSVVYDEILTTYVDGGTTRNYTFTLTVIVPYSKIANSSKNIEWANAVEGISEWINQQLTLNNLPLFPEKTDIQKIEVVDGGEAVAAVDDEGAKYQFAVQITYGQGV